jgi:hypothetical protein
MKYKVNLDVTYVVDAANEKELEKEIKELIKIVPYSHGSNLTRAHRKKVEFVQWEEL